MNKRTRIKYIRDGRAPIPESEKTSRVMSANRAKNTTPERVLRKGLIESGLKGFVVHYDAIPGRPDICYKRSKLAIFVNGCYWHRCPHCKPSMPKTHKDFWTVKFKKNKERDRRKVIELNRIGWKTITIWECQLKKYPDRCVERIEKSIYVEKRH